MASFSHIGVIYTALVTVPETMSWNTDVPGCAVYLDVQAGDFVTMPDGPITATNVPYVDTRVGRCSFGPPKIAKVREKGFTVEIKEEPHPWASAPEDMTVGDGKGDGVAPADDLTIAEPIEAMKAEACRLVRPDGCALDDYEAREADAFARGMSHAATLIAAMVKAQEDEPGFVISVDPSIREMAAQPYMNPEYQKHHDAWAEQFAEAQKNAPPPMSERIAGGEWLP